MKTNISLDDKYALDTTRAYMTGIEALVRLPMLQHQRDRLAGLNTAGFISGYRGSPLGGFDQALWAAEPHLMKHHIHFQPGVNEDLAATAVWGSQQTNLFPGAKYDGVFSMWYGKGPGVDRSMDVIKHGNAFGTSKYGGVLAVAGDDHACKSSSLPHQSEHMFIGASMPVLSPANVQEVLDLGVFGWELSRYSGCWVALKAITENMDSAISAEIDPERVRIVIPEDFEMPPEGLHGRLGADPLEQERILNRYRIYAARNFARVNRLNRIVIDSPNPRLGIITSGKAYLDVLQALEDLEIDAAEAAQIGLRVFKVGMSWPLEPVSTHEFAKGLEEILVVEEKRSIIEDQLTGQLYNWPVEERPRVFGEFDEQGEDLLPNLSGLTPAQVARAIAARINRFYASESIRDRLAFLDAKTQRLATPRCKLDRLPYYCSGCPHNTSTVVPEGSRAMAGIGCHYMAQWMNRRTTTFTHMGGEGATWIGQAPFTETRHVFQNLGDGTYFHSGVLAIRASVAAGVNITYKILYNHAVAMTGGQPLDGDLPVERLVYQLRGEGVKRIAVVSDEPGKYPVTFPQFDGLSIDHRDRLDAIQCELRELSGTTVIVYDQGCAAEKRRQRKQGLLADPPLRVFINEDVCEGCGDCSVKSNCLSVLPKETPLGRKRIINQSACNKDYSCLKGFCPSFVSVVGGELRQSRASITEPLFGPLPEPELPSIGSPWNILVTGIGGTGVLTIGSIISMAAHIEDKGCSTLNQTGLAQKFGAVVSHVRVARTQEDIHAVRIAAGDADLLLGCDLVVADSDDALAKLNLERSYAVVNEYQSATAEFLHNPDLEFPAAAMKQTLREELGEARARFIDATQLAIALLGNEIASNMILLGYAYQRGLVPVSAVAIHQALKLNNVAVAFNQQAFLWGRRAAHDWDAVTQIAQLEQEPAAPAQGLDETIEWRADYLTRYQNIAYADQYREFVGEVRCTERRLMGSRHGEPGESQLGIAVARCLFKLMAYKDEYEVARLYSNGDFLAKLNHQFEGDFKLRFHLAVPWLSKRDKATGHLVKRTWPQWTMSLMSVLAKLKGLRGTRWDIFGYTRDRRMERQLINDYRGTIRHLLEDLSRENYATAVEIAALPDTIRGFGYIKAVSAEAARHQREQLLDRFYGREGKVVRMHQRRVA